MIETVEHAPALSVDSTRDELNSDPIIKRKDTLEEDFLVKTESTFNMMQEDILDIPLKTEAVSEDVIAPMIGTVEDSTEFSFKLESDHVIDTNGILEEDLPIHPSYAAEAETEPLST